MTTAQDADKVVSVTHRLPLPPGNIHGTHFCQRQSRPQGHSATGRIISLKNSNDTIGNRTRDLPVCRVVSEPLCHRAFRISFIKEINLTIILLISLFILIIFFQPYFLLRKATIRLTPGRHGDNNFSVKLGTLFTVALSQKLNTSQSTPSHYLSI